MASLLATGAGASEGLDTLLSRMMLEEQMRQRAAALAEETRHNQATEGNTAEQIRLMSKDREDKLAEAQRALIDKTVSARGIGDQVTEGEFSKETGAGFPSGDYKITPGAKVTKLAGFTSLPGSVSNMTGQGSAAAPVQEDLNVSQGENSPLNAPRLINFRGTEAQRLALDKEMAAAGKPTGTNEMKTFIISDPAQAKTFGVDPNKPFDLPFNSGTGQVRVGGRYIDIGPGSPIQHFEKPPSPDRVLIQTGAGYETRDQARKDLLAGKDVPLPTTTTTRTMMEGAQMLEPHIAKVQAMAEDLDKAGLFGPVMSRIRTALTKAGTIDEFNALIGSDPAIMNDRRAGRFVTSLGLLASGAGRVHGGARGGGSPQMYQAFKELLSDAGTLQMFEGRLDGLNEYMSGYAAGPSGAQPKVNQTPAGDLYQQYLNRTQPRQ